MSDLCPKCKHGWHGLECTGRVNRTGYPFSTQPCGCESSVEEK